MLRLITDTEIAPNWNVIETSVPDDELPPPIPVEALANWLTGIAIPKRELIPTPHPIVIEEVKAPVNVWEGYDRSHDVTPSIPKEERTDNRMTFKDRHGYRIITARFPSHCYETRDIISTGDELLWSPRRKEVFSTNSDYFSAWNAERVGLI